MSAADGKRCIYPGCERPAVPAHPLGGPQPSFCDLEAHNALTAHQERQRRALVTAAGHERPADRQPASEPNCASDATRGG